jgi:hypothetical protein
VDCQINPGEEGLITRTRKPEDHFSAPSLDVLLGVAGMPARIPIFALAVLTHALAALEATRAAKPVRF